MIHVSEFLNREISFLHPTKEFLPKRGYNITSSKNLDILTKMLNIRTKQYNSYVSIATYNDMPRISFAPKKHWDEFKEWVSVRDQTIRSVDFMLDFDSDPTITGIETAWQDVIRAKYMLEIVLGDSAKYLSTWFSGNKGFHILGKCKIGSTWGNTGQEIINKQKDLAMQMELLCPTLDTSIYDTARLRKLLGSYVYSTNFGKTRVIPIYDKEEKDQLQIALATKNTEWFENKNLVRLNNVNLQL